MKTYLPILLLALIGISGCGENVRQATPAVVAQETKITTSPEGTVWRAPELDQRHYRPDISGYDTLAYGLMATKGIGNESVAHFEFWFSSHNAAKEDRHYSLIRFADGRSKPIEKLQHNTERCQEFSNMTNACIFHDSGIVRLSRAELENVKTLGLKFHLGSDADNFESIEIPPNYIQGLLEDVK